VAGDLGSIHSEYKTTSGKVVQLGIFSDKENVGELFVLESICSLPQFTFPFLYCCIAVLISYGLKMDLKLVDCLPSSFFSPSPFDLFFFLQHFIHPFTLLSHFSYASFTTQAS
jgi:hypothetical protein